MPHTSEPDNAALRATIEALVRAIQPLDALEHDQVVGTLQWIVAGAPLCRIQKPAMPPQHLVSYCVVVDPQRQAVLLGDHRKAGLWLPSGGHVEPGEHPRATAQREVQEELGLTASFVWDTPLFLTVTTTVGADTNHTDVSLWYVLRGAADEPLMFDATEFHAIRWFPFAAIPWQRSDPHMARFMGKLQAALSRSVR